MDLYSLVDNLSEEMYLRLKCAVETGKWPEGTVVEQAQKDSALQIIMAYQSRHLNSDEILSIDDRGEIVTKSKQELQKSFKGNTAQQEGALAGKSTSADDETTIARFSDL